MGKSSISGIRARQILDNKGRPMLEVDVMTEGGVTARAASPSGISAGENEVYVLRDLDPEVWNGDSVFNNIRLIKDVVEPALKGMDVEGQQEIDRKLIDLDGTPNKRNLGGNTIYSVSLGCLRAAAQTANVPVYEYLAKDGIKSIPLPTYSYFSGGSYEKATVPFQEITIVPYKAESIMEAVWIGRKVYEEFPGTLQDMTGKTPRYAKMSGWQCPTADPIEAFDLTYEACKRAGVQDKIAFALDCASSELYNPQTKTYNFIDREIDTDELICVLQELTTKYDFLYVEDAINENDWENWSKAARILTRTRLIGDDFTVTNLERLKKAAEVKAVEGFIFKPNQIGTITESIEALKFAKSMDWLVIPSGRAGGVADDVVADFAVGFNCPCKKSGAPNGGDCLYGINFLARVEDLYPDLRPFNFTPYAKFL